MNRRGIELPVNSVIIIALAIFVLLMLAAFFSRSSGELDKTQVNSAFNQGCSLLASAYNCDYDKVDQIKTNLVVNGQAQTFFEVCKRSFNDRTMSELRCKNACQTCQKYVYQGSPCEEESDCISPLTQDWKCCFYNLEPDGTCKQSGDEKTTGSCYSPLVIGHSMVVGIPVEGKESN